MLFAFRNTIFDIGNQLLHIQTRFRCDDVFTATRNRRGQRQVTTVTTHDFYDRDTLV
ncbi:Uncharacterised protein [Vibrio cholerae]|nr:Uncharacterised protein [Vibrio cholerae]CSI43274.1 Uncharacterised protein [Vibrio cholerae]